MKCPSWGAEVRAGDVFCGECGSQLPQEEKKGRRLALPAVAALIGVVVGVGICVLLCVVTYVAFPWATPTP